MTKAAYDKIAAGLEDAIAMTDTTETMAERVARSMRLAYDPHAIPWKGADPAKKREWMVCARAAIAAMECDEFWLNLGFDRTEVDSLNAMIQAARSEKPE